MTHKSPRYRAAEFAKKAGVTVRTLHHYDRMGLLKPVALSDSGHRLYGEHELIQLERIAALKFIGLPLSAIKELISHDAAGHAETLRTQRQCGASRAVDGLIRQDVLRNFDLHLDYPEQKIYLLPNDRYRSAGAPKGAT